MKAYKNWKDFDKLLKDKYKRFIMKPSADGKTKKAICWISKVFSVNEFYYQFGLPGLHWHGYLPVDVGGECYKFKSDDEDYKGFAYYELEMRTPEALQIIIECTDESDRILAKMDKDIKIKSDGTSIS